MKMVLVAAAALAAVLSAPSAAQSTAAPGACFIELHRLMADGPDGIGDLRTAIAQLDARLRPQVVEVTRLKRLVETLEAQQQQAMQAAGANGEDSATAGTRDVTRVSEDLRHTNDDLSAKQAQLKADYETQMRAIVGPVQQRIGQRATAFSVQQKCGSLKMARAPDLAALRSSGARDLTGEFVSWYSTKS